MSSRPVPFVVLESKCSVVDAGLHVQGRIKDPGFLEGGDFFPAGRDLALLGIGLRSNYAAAQQLMDNDWLGTTRFAVVRDEFDKDQDRMHLDCVFSILTHDCCLMCEDMMGAESKTRRLVDLWVRDRRTGKYKMDKEGVEFAAFMKARLVSVPQSLYPILSMGNRVP